jgi:hypothetical protein
MRLNCRNAENLIVTDDVLIRAGIDWNTLKTRIEQWLSNNTTHPHSSAMQSFNDSGFDRKNADLKEIRNDLVGLMGSNKPWEVLVGQTIAGLIADSSPRTPYSLREFLGSRICELLLQPPSGSGAAAVSTGGA